MKASTKQQKAAVAAVVGSAHEFEGVRDGSGTEHQLVAAELVAEAGTEVVVPEPDAILTIKPEVYVEAVFQPFEDRLADAVAQVDTTPRYDIKSAAGFDTAKKLCALFTKVRTDAERAREERKAPFLNMGRLLDARAKQVKAAVSKHEDKLAALIEAEETRRADEKAAEVAAEAAKVAAIEKKIAQIRSAPGMAVGQSIANIAALIERLKGCVIDEAGYGDYVDIANDAKAASLAALEAAHAAQVQAEADRAELEKLRAQVSQLAPASGPAGSGRPATPPPPAFDDEPPAAPATGGSRMGTAPCGAQSTVQPTTTPLDALYACHAVLTGMSNARGDAIRAAAAVLRAYGRLPAE